MCVVTMKVEYLEGSGGRAREPCARSWSASLLHLLMREACSSFKGPLSSQRISSS